MFRNLKTKEENLFNVIFPPHDAINKDDKILYTTTHSNLVELEKSLHLYTIYKLLAEYKLLVQNKSKHVLKKIELQSALDTFRKQFPNEVIPGHSLRIKVGNKSALVHKASPREDFESSTISLMFQPENLANKFPTIDLDNFTTASEPEKQFEFLNGIVNYLEKGTIPYYHPITHTLQIESSRKLPLIISMIYTADYYLMNSLFDKLLFIHSDNGELLLTELLKHPFMSERIVGLRLSGPEKLEELPKNSINLKRIYFDMVSLEFAKNIVERYKSLIHCGWSLSPFSDQSEYPAIILKKLPNLKFLNIIGEISQNSFNTIIELSHLETLRITSTFEEKILLKICNLKNLKSLNLDARSLTAEGVGELIESLPNLEKLVLSSFPGKTIVQTKQFAKMKHLAFGYCLAISDEGLIKVLSLFPNLESLCLDYTANTDKVLPEIKKLKELSFLSINCEIHSTKSELQEFLGCVVQSGGDD